MDSIVNYLPKDMLTDCAQSLLGVKYTDRIWGNVCLERRDRVSDCYVQMAEVYDRLMSDVDYDLWAESILRLIKRFGHEKQSLRVLDCACGTGALTIRLAERGFLMTGLDCSEDMLRVAQRKSMRRGLKIPYVCMDMQNLQMHRRMDAITCCCDGVNYLTDPAEVMRFFRSAHAALKPDGIFLFDVSSAYKLEHVLGCSVMGEDRPDCTYLWENMFDPETRLLEMRLHFFVPNQSNKALWHRFDETHVQRAYTQQELCDLLIACGFEPIGIYGAFTEEQPAADAERIQFAARRKEQ